MSLPKPIAWKPSESDTAWMHNLVNRINEGGIWMLPANGSIWKLEHSKKLARVLDLGSDMQLTAKTAAAFQAIGWTTEEASPGEN